MSGEGPQEDGGGDGGCNMSVTCRRIEVMMGPIFPSHQMCVHVCFQSVKECGESEGGGMV